MDSRNIWSPRNFYMYLVCLITLVMCITAVVDLATKVVEWVYPEPLQVFRPRVAPGEEPYTAEELEEQQRQQREWSRRNLVLGTVRDLVMLLVAGPIYLYHWRRIERGGRRYEAIPAAGPPMQA